MVARRNQITQTVRDFKGCILFEGPHPTLRSTSLESSCLLPHNTLSANSLSNWTAHCIGLSYITAHILQV